MIFASIDLLVLGFAVASTGFLGFLVYFNNPKSATSRAFLGFSLVSIAWGISNYLSAQATSGELIVWMWRLVIFLAVWFCFGIYHLAIVFPEEKPTYVKRYIRYVIPATAFASGLTLTPLVFKDVTSYSSGIPVIQNGPLIFIFALTIFSLVSAAVFTFVHKLRKAKGRVRSQYWFIAAGTIITFTLLLTFNFILPAGFHIVRYIPFGSVFLLPFVAFTGYAIARYRLLHTRVVLTEVFAFLVVVTAIFQVLFSTSLLELLLRVSIFVLFLVFDILLIRLTVNELKQRELIETQERELEESNTRLRELDKQKTEFLSFASHQLRTPLTAIKWSAAAMIDGTYGVVPKHLEDPIRTIFSQSTLMAVFINDYLNVSRIEQGKMEYRFVPVNLVETLEESAKELRGAIEEHGLSLTMQVTQDRPMVWGDPDKLTQVFTNIMDNAMKYTPKGGITISLERLEKEGMIRVVFADTGIGMDEKTLSSVFSKFTRGDNAMQINSAGSGLGLFIVKTFVEAHKGTIHIESDGIGKGSRFVIELPLLVQSGDGKQAERATSSLAV